MAVSNGPSFDVVFSADASEVELTPVDGGDRLRGTREQASRAQGGVSYALDAFAGGRFVVTVGGGALGAELTLYGSGVPIAESTRGTLVSEL